MRLHKLAAVPAPSLPPSEVQRPPDVWETRLRPAQEYALAAALNACCPPHVIIKPRCWGPTMMHAICCSKCGGMLLNKGDMQNA